MLTRDDVKQAALDALREHAAEQAKTRPDADFKTMGYYDALGTLSQAYAKLHRGQVT